MITKNPIRLLTRLYQRGLGRLDDNVTDSHQIDDDADALYYVGAALSMDNLLERIQQVVMAANRRGFRQDGRDAYYIAELRSSLLDTLTALRDFLDNEGENRAQQLELIGGDDTNVG